MTKSWSTNAFRVRGTDDWAMHQMSQLHPKVQKWIRDQPDHVRQQIYESAKQNTYQDLNRFLQNVMPSSPTSARGAEQSLPKNRRGTNEYAMHQLSQLHSSIQTWIKAQPDHVKAQIFESAKQNDAANLNKFLSQVVQAEHHAGIAQDEQRYAADQANNRAWQVMSTLSEDVKQWISNQPPDVRAKFFDSAKTSDPQDLENFAQGLMGNAAAGDAPTYDMPPPFTPGSGTGAGVQLLPGGGSPGGAGGGSGGKPEPGKKINGGTLGGTIYRFMGKAVIVFVVDGIAIWYDESAENPLEGGIVLTTAAQMNNLKATMDQGVDGGNSTELLGMQQDGLTYQKYWDRILDKVFPRDSDARKDKGVLKIIAQLAGRPDMSESELTNLLMSTEYFNNLTAEQAKWNDYSDAEQKFRIDEASADLAKEFWEKTGSQIALTDNDLKMYAHMVASGQRSFDSIVATWIKPEAEKNGESPWSRSLRNETENQRRRGFDIENKQADIQALANQWGVKLQASVIESWAKGIISMNRSDDDLLEYMKDQAQVLYQWKDREQVTEEAAQPFLQAYGATMEKNGTVFTPEVQQAMQQGVNVFEFEKQLKSGDGWMETKNFQKSAEQTLGSISQEMGFS